MNKYHSFFIIILFLLVSPCKNAQCHGNPGAKSINQHPIWKGKPTLVATHQYGKLYEIGSEVNRMKLLHVFGDMYQMGYAHGYLLRRQLNIMIPQVWDYIKSEFEDDLPKKIPNFLRKPASGLFVGSALDLTFRITFPFTNRKYYEQMRGISEGSGVSLKLLRRIHMIGQLTKGTCSMFGAWGKATTDGKVIQLRALDWDIDGPFRKYPLITVYHPSSAKLGVAWLNIGFYGWIGVVSGVNSHRIGVSQIGVYFNDETFGKESRFGNPFTFVLRDILQFSTNLNQSIAHLKSTRRTCNLILGVGDGNMNTFRGFQYSHSVLNVVDDINLLPKNDTWHAVLQNVVYYGMDWMCPPFHARLHQMLQEYHGGITVENTIKFILPGLNSGNLQAVVYDLVNEWVYFSYGIKQGGKKYNAYQRPYIGLELKQLFMEEKP